MSKEYRSDGMTFIYETMEALHKVGAIDKQTMRRFDETCLTQIRLLRPKQIKALRERMCVSQTVFANYLNVTANLVSKWEQGEKRPSRLALKLLSLVEKHGLAAVPCARAGKLRGVAMVRISQMHKKGMEEAEYRKAYDAVEEQFALADAVVGARNRGGLGQAELARKW